MSIRNSFIILDEAQNATFRQLRMFLTRFAQNSKVVINGDYTQSDIHTNNVPLFDVISKLEARSDFHSKPISVVRMSRQDIVRHPLIQWLDETLTGDYDEAWHSIKCPACQANLWLEQDAMDDIIECWKCASAIEVLDSYDKIDPIAIKHSGERYKAFPKRQ